MLEACFVNVLDTDRFVYDTFTITVHIIVVDNKSMLQNHIFFPNGRTVNQMLPVCLNKYCIDNPLID